MPAKTYLEKLKACAARMRKHPTPAELIFRERLAQTGVRFISQQIVGRYIVDFVVPEKMIVFELDGKGHSQPSKILYDKKRTEFLTELGFKVKRIPNRKASTYPLKRLRFKNPAKKGAFDRAVHLASVAIKERSEAFAQRQLLKAMDKAAPMKKTTTGPRLVKRSAA